MGKHPRCPHPPSESPRTSQFLDLIHADLCGPIPITTPHNKQYFIVFLDNHTNVLNLQLLSMKDQAIDAWRLICARWENQSGLWVKVFHSDNGGEFLNTAFTKELEDMGIVGQLSAPYVHQQNGKAERVIRTIEGRMYAMLDHAHLPRNLWGEVALTAAYLFNCTESRSLLPGKTPYEMLHGAKPDVSHLRVFGVRCFVRIPSELQEKMGPRSREAIFLGYPPGVEAWRCRDTITGAFFNSQDVIFDESFSNRSFPNVNSDDDDEEDAAPHSTTTLPLALPPNAPSAPPAAPARHSGRIANSTECGQQFCEQLAADAAHLQQQRDLRNARVQGIPPADDPDAHVPPIPIVPHPALLPAPSHPLADDNIIDGDAIRADVDTVGFPQMLANLIVTELACITIHSDSCRNSQTPGYDMKVPQNSYDEAMRRSDRDFWLAAMKREMNLMSEMNVY